MTITNERAEVLSAYITSDMERAQRLLNMPIGEALVEINADGNDFTTEELAEFGEQIKVAIATQQNNNGELNEVALDNVSGGLVVSAAVFTAGVTLFLGGVTLGATAASQRGW